MYRAHARTWDESYFVLECDNCGNWSGLAARSTSAAIVAWKEKGWTWGGDVRSSLTRHYCPICGPDPLPAGDGPDGDDWRYHRGSAPGALRWG